MLRVNYSLPFENWINEYGEIFKIFGDHDSGNISYGINTTDSQKYFIKFAPYENKSAIKYLENAYTLGKNINHSALSILRFAVDCSDGLALIYDWYDGCIIYNFEKDKLHIIDLDIYNKSSFVNYMGRMYGSNRFMAPEEFILGETIDNRTTVYHMGATVYEFLGTGKKEPKKGFKVNENLLHVALKAIQKNKKDRYSSVQEFYSDWLKAL